MGPVGFGHGDTPIPERGSEAAMQTVSQCHAQDSSKRRKLRLEWPTEDHGLTDSQPAFACPPVSVIPPSYNEDAAVAGQVEAIRRVLHAHRIKHEIIVVDDGSHDQTALAATKVGARVIRHVV